MKRIISVAMAAVAVVLWSGVSFGQDMPASTSQPVVVNDLPEIQDQLAAEAARGWKAPAEEAVVTSSESIDFPEFQGHYGASPEWGVPAEKAIETEPPAFHETNDLPAMQGYGR